MKRKNCMQPRFVLHKQAIHDLDGNGERIFHFLASLTTFLHRHFISLTLSSCNKKKKGPFCLQEHESHLKFYLFLYIFCLACSGITNQQHTLIFWCSGHEQVELEKWKSPHDVHGMQEYFNVSAMGTCSSLLFIVDRRPRRRREFTQSIKNINRRTEYAPARRPASIR
jgi:hypothetical protein